MTENKTRISLGLSLLAVVVISTVISQLPADPKQGADQALFAAQRGPLTISVLESGTIDHREKKIIQSTLEGQSTILYLIPEGTSVSAGERLIQLDTSQLEENRQQQEIILLNADAAHVFAQQKLEVVRNKNSSDAARAELDLRFAEADLRKYTQGDYPMERQQARAEITIAREELSRALDKLEWSVKLEEEGYINRAERLADEHAATQKKLEVELAEKRLTVLENYTHPRTMQELESNIDQARNALERKKRIARADVLQGETEVQAKASELKRQQDKLVKIEKQISSCLITAPVDGEVIYATTNNDQWNPNQEPLREGQQVREGQDLLYLPTTKAMMALIKVHESNLLKIRPGLPVRITADALPDREFPGLLGKISPLPDAVSAWLNPDLKLYSAEVYLQTGSDELRPGMSCMARIFIQEYDEVIYVPVQSVSKIGDRTVVYVSHPDSVEQRSVEIGQNNNRLVHIVRGLQPGEAVLLNPPLAFSEAPVREPAENFAGGDEQEKKSGETAGAAHERLRRQLRVVNRCFIWLLKSIFFPTAPLTLREMG